MDLALGPAKFRFEGLVSQANAQIYKKLDPAKREIRLLEILPADEETASIRCRLHKVSLDGKPEYVALSYVWGDLEEERKTIFVNDRALLIRPNLFDALRTIRSDQFSGCFQNMEVNNLSIATLAWSIKKGLDQRATQRNDDKFSAEIHDQSTESTIRFWADAICIDQNNLEERNGQVEIMSVIYSQPRLTISWLGIDENRSLGDAFTILDLLAKQISQESKG